MVKAYILCIALLLVAHGSLCYGLREILPNGLQREPETPKVIECLKKTDPDDCDYDYDCTWCTSSIGSGCYWVRAAKYLPRSFFTCDCDNYASAGDASLCDGKSQADCIHPTCVWCKSAAVGGKCYTPEDAKRLPSAIFSCDFGVATQL